MPKIKVTSEKVKELFGNYDDCQEEPIECGIRVRKFLTELLKTWSVPKSQVEKTTQVLDNLRMSISEAKRSRESSELDKTSFILADKRKNDEQTLRRMLSKAKEHFDNLIEHQRFEALTLKYALVGATASIGIGIAATYALSLFYPLRFWEIGQLTAEIGLVVSIILAFYAFRALRYNSSPTQVAVTIIAAPLLAVLTTTCIVIACNALISALIAVDGSVPFHFPELARDSSNFPTIDFSGETMRSLGILLSIPVGLLLAFVAGSSFKRLITLRALRPARSDEKQSEDEEDN